MADDTDTRKLTLEVEKLKWQFLTTLAASVIGPVLLGLLQLWIAHENAKETKAAAADVKTVAAEKAAEIKTELSAAKAVTDQTLGTVAAGVDASVRSWKAYQTKEPEDMNAATQAVVNAERLTEQMPAVVPK